MNDAIRNRIETKYSLANIFPIKSVILFIDFTY